MYNHVPLTIRELSYDVEQFRQVLKRFIQNPFILWKSILTLTGNECCPVCCKS